MASEFRDVDPRELRVPTSRPSGADPAKLQRQTSLFAASTDGMPPIWVTEGSDGALVINDGVTRATRAAKLAPGRLVTVEIIARVRRPVGRLPRIRDFLP